jgi:hypothetical protein
MRGVTADATTKPRRHRSFVPSGGSLRKSPHAPVRGFKCFKWLVYALLALNVALYARHGTPSELLDTAAWLLLLLLFEWETGGWPLPARLRQALRGVRVVASVAVVWACIGYAGEAAWLDFANALAWLGVVAVLELEVRLPPQALRLHRARRATAILLYALLAAFALAWVALGVRGGGAAFAAWLDAWDALLWLVAFGAIELNVFRFGAAADAAAGPDAQVAPSS